MKCHFQHLNHEGLVNCSHHRVSYPAAFPQSICESCVLRQDPIPQPAAGPVPDMLHFVWVYWQGGARGDELRLSIRSVEQNALFPVKITVIGDRPSWYTGHFLRKPQISPCENHNIADQLSKTVLMSEHPDIGEHIIWMMDDIFFLSPFAQEDVMLPRGVRFSRSARNAWQILKGRTADVLQERGYPTIDYATHAPHYVEKTRLQGVIEEFGLKSRTLIWENLYNNVVRREHHPIRPWLARIKNPLSKNDFYRHTANSAVCNTTDSAWCSGIRDAIAEICPFPSSVEQPGTFPEDITRVNNAPAVKRRPEHLRDKEAYHAHLRSIGVLIR